jgi:hypothetical protein
MGLLSFFKRGKQLVPMGPPAPNSVAHVTSVESATIDDPISLRDQLVLLLITKSGINNVHKLGMRFDRHDFPGNEGKNLLILLDRQLIYVSVANKFNHPIKYASTEKGEKYVRNNINPELIIEHVKKMSNPGFMLELVQLIFENS